MSRVLVAHLDALRFKPSTTSTTAHLTGSFTTSLLTSFRKNFCGSSTPTKSFQRAVLLAHGREMINATVFYENDMNVCLGLPSGLRRRVVCDLEGDVNDRWT